MTGYLPSNLRTLMDALARAPAETEFERVLEQLRQLLLQLYPTRAKDINRLIDRLWATDLRTAVALEAACEEVQTALGADVQQALSAPDHAPKEVTKDDGRARMYQIWYGTNRRPVDRARLDAGFADEGEPDPLTVHYGTCQVAIPRSHRFGSLGSSFFQRWVTWTDDRLQLRLIRSEEPAAFWRGIQDELLRWDECDRQVLVFLHGFNVTFQEAALRAAQLGFDLNFPGVMSFFSWPSCGQGRKYTVDEATIDSCERPITEFLLKLVEDVGAERVHIVAHSMGNRPLLRAVRTIADDSALNQRIKFGQIVLAAPDVDARLFRQLGPAYPLLSQRTTHYVSPRDRAVGLSRWLHGHDRAGFAPPLTLVQGIDTIQVPKLNSEFFGHNFFASAEALLSDIYTLLRSNVAPGARPRFRPDEVQTQDGLPYWILGS